MKERVEPFLLATRVGIDFGEGKGGIAIERGRRINGQVINEIIYDEVFCDFHDATLEERRSLRRGRRSRHAKEIRLARLRSWVLRQADPTKNGEITEWHKANPHARKLPKNLHLPDPYRLMRQREYQCQPFEYAIGRKQLKVKTGFEKHDDSPFSLPTWIEAVKSGKRSDSASFVIALTHIFQKRGYSYSDAELAGLTDAQLEGFLASAALKNSSLRFVEKIEKQIARRENISDDDNQSWRGKNPGDRIKPEELKGLLSQAKERTPKRRKAVHRREKVELLRNVIQGFIQNLSKLSEEKAELIDRWQKELAGDVDQDFDPRLTPNGLLSKTIRPPRFDNRVAAGCAWCGRTCARRTRSRRDAFLAAVNNLSVWEVPPKSALLENWKREQLAALWQEGQTDPAEARQKFFRRSRLFGVPGDKQKEIARLLDDWSTNDQEARAKIKRLRTKVPGQKPRPLSSGERAKFERLWTGDLKKDVTQDSEFWKSFNQKISACFKELREAGHPVAKEEMKKQLTDLLTVKPQGRHRLCVACLKKAARGETKFQQGILPWEIKSRGTRNPRREQHQERLLKRLEFLLFHAKRKDGSKLVPDPRQIKFITLEIPKPQNKNTPRKGQQTRTDRRSPKALLHEEASERCIYCDKEIPVTEVREEHIFPLAQGGPDVRDLNLICSCQDCNDAKGNNLPWVWRDHVKPAWQEFERRVRANARISPRKKDVLLLGSHEGHIDRLECFKWLGIPPEKLSANQREQFSILASWQPGEHFPSDPTALARAGSMPRQFIVGIREIFHHNGFGEDDLPVITPKGDLPLIQKAEGWLTSRLRNSWRFETNGRENFPAKRREESLEHHAQDAALLAALPPHQWRDQIFIDVEKRLSRDEDGHVVSNDTGKTVTHEYTVALKELAPSWREFDVQRKLRREPLVHFLESKRSSHRKAWRSKFINKSFWTVYCPNGKCDPELQFPISLESLYAAQSWICQNCGATIRDADSPFVSARICQHKPHWESLTHCENKECHGELKDLTRNQAIVGKYCLSCGRRFFISDIPGQRRQNQSSQQQGQVLILKPSNGPPRIVNTEAVAESICLVENDGRSYVKFRLQPAIARLTGFTFEPRLAEGDRILRELSRKKPIFLPQESKQLQLVKRDEERLRVICFHAAAWPFLILPEEEMPVEAMFVFPEGFYRIRKLSLSARSAEVWPEVLANGVSGNARCCPALGKPLLNESEIGDLKERGAIFTTPKQFPKRAALGVTELTRLYNQ